MNQRLAVSGSPDGTEICGRPMAADKDLPALRLCLFGAAPDTGNMGVMALCHSTVAALALAEPTAQLTIFDHGRGLRAGTIPLATGSFPVTLCGASYSRRLYRSDSLGNARVRSWLGGAGSPILRQIREADAVLDLSAGDSFTDLYGPRRFAAIMLHKRLVLGEKKPLLLLPQTYGPFHSSGNRRVAQEILRRTRMAWARDADSHAALQELLGPDFDPARHRQGVDMAFRLPAIEPPGGLSEPTRSWLEHCDEAVIGINVSGLIYGRPETSHRQFGLRASYPDLIHQLVEKLLVETKVRILLVPHVLVERGQEGSDHDACHMVLQRFVDRYPARIAMLTGGLDASGVKWVVGRLHWFCGTRMHSAIAALSQGIPSAAIAYSLKTRGVFASCGVGDAVADPRHLETGDALACLWRAWENRALDRALLAEWLPRVKDQHRQQIEVILAACRQNMAR